MSSFTSAIEAGRAFLKVTVDDSDVAKGFERVQAKLNTIGQKMQKWGAITTGVSAAVVGSVGLAAKSFAAAGAALDDMSKRTGFSAKSLSALSYAAQQSGTDIKGIEKAIRGMEKFMLGASRGGAGFTATLEGIGVELKELEGRSPEQQFQVLSEAIARVDDPTTRAALAMKVFGKAGSDLLPLLIEGKAGIANLVAEAHRLGLVLTNEDVAAAAALDDTLARLTTQSEMAFNQIGAAVAGPLTDFGDKMTIVLGSVTQLIKAHPDLVTGIASIGSALTIAGGAATLFGTALTAITAHPVVAGVTVLALAVGELATTFEAAQKAAEDLATHGTAALEKMTKQQLEAMKSNLEWRVFFESLDYRQLHDEGLAGKRSLSERALAAVNNALEAIDNPAPASSSAGGTAIAGPTSVPHVNQPSNDPWVNFLARAGAADHPMGGRGGEKLKRRLGEWADSALGVANAFGNPLAGVDVGGMASSATRTGNKMLAGKFDWDGLGEGFGQGMGQLMQGVNEFLYGKAGSSFSSSLGTFNASAIGSLSGVNVDKQMLDVLTQSLDVQRRLERKEDPWKAT